MEDIIDISNLNVSSVEDWIDLSFRLLQESNSSTGNSTSSKTTETYNDSATLRSTLRLYGTIFVVLMLLFCYLRKKYPRAYNTRSWIESIKTPLAEKQFGFGSWLYKLWLVSDYDMLEECGMDALCYTRVLELGLKLSLVGMFVGIWLMPVYATAGLDIDDGVVAISTSNVPNGSPRFLATVVAAYVVFGYCMYAMLNDFEWFYLYRYQFLKNPTRPRNFSVYVRNIPEEYLSSGKLREFFARFASGIAGTSSSSAALLSHDTTIGKNDILGSDGVVDACVSLKIPNLKKKVAQRVGLLTKLERAITVEDVTGKIVRQKDNRKVIDALYEQLKDLNADVADSIDRITKLNEQQEQRDKVTRRSEFNPLVGSSGGGNDDAFLSSYDGRPISTTTTAAATTTTTTTTAKLGFVDENVATLSTDDSFTTNATPSNGDWNSMAQDLTDDGTNNDPRLGSTMVMRNPRGGGGGGSVPPPPPQPQTSGSLARIGGIAGNVAKAASATAGSALSLFSTEDGKPLTAGFVTFSTVQPVYAALQMTHYPQPFAMEVLEAPGVDDINWPNVGKTHKELQLGMLLSMTLTTMLCLFWTIPMSFISTLSNIEGLKGSSTFVTNLLEAAPWLEPILAQLAPLLIIVAGVVLKMILEMLSGLEGPVSGAVVQASLFSKLAAFSIIQTFFVTAISGSLLSQLTLMIQNPNMIIDLLATTLPAQSTFYIQILIVQTCISLCVELLRVPALVQAGLRRCLGPRLTQEERETTWCGIRPLADPDEFSHADVLSGTVLYFLVYFVYAALAPLTSFIMFTCFLFIGSGYRHQFVYVYPTKPDSGGKLWVQFMKLIPSLMLMAQVTILGFLGLKRSALGLTLMIPLVVITVLFRIYISQQHFLMADYLPSRECMEFDRQNNKDNHNLDLTFLKGRYVQPELQEKHVYPQNATLERQIQQQMINPGPSTTMRSDNNSATAIPTADGSIYGGGDSSSRRLGSGGMVGVSPLSGHGSLLDGNGTVSDGSIQRGSSYRN